MTAILAALWMSTASASDGSLSAGYLGEWITHPGVFAAIERPVAARGVFSVGAGGRAGLYHHQRHHTALLATAEITGRATAPGGPFVEVGLGLGARHRFVTGPVYRATDDGASRTVDLGRPGLLGTAALGAGVGVARHSDRPMRVFGRLEAWAGYPHNRRIVPTVAVTLGVGWSVR